MTYCIKKEAEEFDIPLPLGGKLRLRSISDVSMNVARAAARKKHAELLQKSDELKKIGVDPEKDLGDPEIISALFKGVLIMEIATRHIISWEGIADETGTQAAEVNPENISRLLKSTVVAEEFYSKVVAEMMPVFVSKKDLRTAASGISPAAPATAEDASN